MIKLEVQSTKPKALRTELKSLASIVKPVVDTMPLIDVTVTHPALADGLRTVIERTCDVELGRGVSIVAAAA